MDEPTAFLDMGGRIELMRALRKITHQSGIGTVLSTHDLDLALRYTDQIWLMPRKRPKPRDPGHSLDGRLTKTISNEALQWDLEKRAMAGTQNRYASISLHATGPEKMWTNVPSSTVVSALATQPEAFVTT